MVEQSDQEAAASVAVLVEMRELIRAGKADHHAEPFARHRIASQKAMLDLVERHAKAKQYSPAPYTDIMGEIAKIREAME